MKRLLLLAGLFVIAVWASLGLFACGPGGGNNPGSVPVTGVTLNKTSTSILVNGTEPLTATIVPANATNRNVTWSSSDPAMATVSASGLVTGVAVGTATITVTTADGGFTADCAVTVSPAVVPVTGVTLNKTSTSILISGTEQLTATISPANATNQNVTWSSNDPNAATVSASGLVTGVAVGTATITATTVDGGFTANCTVTVHAPGEKVTLNAGGVSITLAYVPGNIAFPTNVLDITSAVVSAPYWIGETEVTYQVWSAVYDWATANGYNFANSGIMGIGDTLQHPAGYISWRDAMVWCNALTELFSAQSGTAYTAVYTYSGAVIKDSRDTNATACDNAVADSTATGFRLPTANEWELAARYRIDTNNDGDILDAGEYYPGSHVSGDTTSYSFPQDSGTSSVFGDYAWYLGNTNSKSAVKSKLPNALGLYDMSGSVWELCSDKVTNTGGRTMMGGSYDTPTYDLQVGRRPWEGPSARWSDMGFRVVITE